VVKFLFFSFSFCIILLPFYIVFYIFIHITVFNTTAVIAWRSWWHNKTMFVTKNKKSKEKKLDYIMATWFIIKTAKKKKQKLLQIYWFQSNIYSISSLIIFIKCKTTNSKNFCFYFTFNHLTGFTLIFALHFYNFLKNFWIWINKYLNW